jgi:hypothetical protein
MTDQIPEKIQAMIDEEGIYVCGDTAFPCYTVVVVSIGGKLFSIVLDNELDPTRFLPTLTIAGPFHKPPSATTGIKVLSLAQSGSTQNHRSRGEFAVSGVSQVLTSNSTNILQTDRPRHSPRGV